MTPEQKIEAIKALIDGEYDNPELLKCGYLYDSFEINVKMILDM